MRLDTSSHRYQFPAKRLSFSDEAEAITIRVMEMDAKRLEARMDTLCVSIKRIMVIISPAERLALV